MWPTIAAQFGAVQQGYRAVLWLGQAVAIISSCARSHHAVLACLCFFVHNEM